MGEILVTTFVTIDGVMQANGDPEDGRSEGFDYGGWQAPYTDREVSDQYRHRAADDCVDLAVAAPSFGLIRPSLR